LLRTIFVTGILVLSAGTRMPESFACSCTEATFGEHIEHADLVFVGTCASSVGGDGVDHWDFADAVFVKGGEQNEAPSVRVSTPDDSAACGYDFEIGDEYVVFVLMHEGEMQTGLCSGNMPTSELTESQIQALSELQVSGVDFGNDGGTTEDAGDSVGEHACDESDSWLNGCVPLGLITAMTFLAAAGITGFAIIKKKRR